MEILVAVFHNVSLVELLALVALFLLASCLYVIQDAVRDTLRFRRFAAFRAEEEAEEDHGDSLAASYVPPSCDPRDDLAYQEDSVFSPAQSGQGLIAYMLILVLLFIVVAIVVGILLSALQSVGIETLIDGVQILSSL